MLFRFSWDLKKRSEWIMNLYKKLNEKCVELKKAPKFSTTIVI